MGNIHNKEETQSMISITKQQRDYLEAHGCLWEEDLHRTHTKHKTYFATENPKVKALLKQYEIGRKKFRK